MSVGLESRGLFSAGDSLHLNVLLDTLAHANKQKGHPFVSQRTKFLILFGFLKDGITEKEGKILLPITSSFCQTKSDEVPMSKEKLEIKVFNIILHFIFCEGFGDLIIIKWISIICKTWGAQSVLTSKGNNRVKVCSGVQCEQ